MTRNVGFLAPKTFSPPRRFPSLKKVKKVLIKKFQIINKTLLLNMVAVINKRLLLNGDRRRGKRKSAWQKAWEAHTAREFLPGWLAETWSMA